MATTILDVWHANRPALPRCLAAFLALLLTAGGAAAFDAVGTIGQIDAGRNLLQIRVDGRDRTVAVAEDVRILGTDGEPLPNGLLAGELRPGVTVTITVERGSRGPVVRAIRLGRHQAEVAVPGGARASTGLRPLSDMAADDRYQGEDGGLYGGGSNAPPPAHLAAARKQTAGIVARAADGTPSADGKIGLVSISMSNATQEFSRFQQIADRDTRKSPQVAIVDCAQGGQAMAEWADPDARAWSEADRRLRLAGVAAEQVQVIWVKLANKGPRGDLAEHGGRLRADTLSVLQHAMARFPNLRIAYLGSRIYGGYATTPLNPEPYAYEGAFVVRGLIQAQMQGDPELGYEDVAGAAKAPLLLWGPYFWADGINPRKIDGLRWQRGDLAGDGTHPSESGRQKAAELLLKFFAEDPLAATWFVKPPGEP